MAFEIEEGVVKVTADVDRSALARAARSAGESAGQETEKGFRKGFGRSAQSNQSRVSSMIVKLFTPDANMFETLKAPFAKALSTPVGAAAIAVAGVFASTFAAAAATAVLGVGLGAALLGAGVMALVGGKADRDKALADLEKAEQKVKDAQFAARKGSATAIRNLAQAREQLQMARQAVDDGKAFAALDDALDSVSETFKKISVEAAKPLLKPLTGALNDVTELIRQLGPEFKSIFSSLAPVIKPLNDALGQFLGEIVRGLQDSMPGIVAAFEGLSNALPVVGKWIGDFFRTIFENDGVIDNTTEDIIKLVFGPLKLLGPVISGLTVLFGAWNNAMTLLKQVYGEVWGVITDSTTDFFQFGESITRIKEAWGPLGDAIQDVWDKIKAFAGEDNPGKLMWRFEELKESLKKAWEELKKFAQIVWDEIWLAIKRAWNEKVVPWWEGTAKPWLKEALGEAFDEAWDLVKKKTVAKLEEMKQSAINRIKAMVAAVILEITSMPGRAANALAGLAGQVASKINQAKAAAVQGAASLVTGTINEIAKLAGRVGSEVGKVRGKVTGAFSGAGGWLVSAGRSIMGGLLQGIKSAWENTAGYLSSLGGKIKALKGPIEKDRVMLVPEGQAIMEGLLAGIESRAGVLASYLRGLTADIPQIASGPASSMALAGGGPSFLPPSSPSSSGSSASMTPSFNVQVYVGDREIKDVVRVEINEHDRSLGGQVSSGTGGFRL